MRTFILNNNAYLKDKGIVVIRQLSKLSKSVIVFLVKETMFKSTLFSLFKENAFKDGIP